MSKLQYVIAYFQLQQSFKAKFLSSRFFNFNQVNELPKINLKVEQVNEDPCIRMG